MYALYSRLSQGRRQVIETKYRQLLKEYPYSILNKANSVSNFLKFLGPSPLTDSRYIWGSKSKFETKIDGIEMSSFFSTDYIKLVLHAILIALYKFKHYPLVGRSKPSFFSLSDIRIKELT